MRDSSFVEFAYDYHQLYVYDGGLELSTVENPFLDALDAATESGLTVGAASGIVDLLMPRQENFAARLDFSVLDSVPPLATAADHVVEFDVVSTGRLVLEGSGGAGKLEIDAPAGRFRARLSGFDYDTAQRWSYDDDGYPGDHYRLELWRCDVPQPPAELRRWQGYDAQRS